MQDRIVITGMGTVNPLGLNVKDTWSNLIAGVSGVGPITLFDSRAAAMQVHIAAEVKNFRPENFMDAKEARRRDRFEQFNLDFRSQNRMRGGSV
jgi:3-oxoacyl-[acyl-carrier-protein] synthase II